MEKIVCNLYDLFSNEAKKPFEYKSPIYTKLDGVYGYISVSGDKVYFFWYSHSSETISCDDISDRFKIEYIISYGK